MSIDAFCLKNFMAFANTSWIELRRLNLLLGRNSSGKTAVIRALRLMQQSLFVNDGSEPLVFVSEGGVDVGSFEAILHKALPMPTEADGTVSEGDAEIHDELRHWSKAISFSFRGSITTDKEQVKEWAVLPSLALDTARSENATFLGFEVKLSFSRDYQAKKVFLRKFELFYRERESQLLLGFDRLLSSWYVRSKILASELEPRLPDLFKLNDGHGFLPILEETEEHFSDDEQKKDIHAIIQFWQHCRNEIEYFLKSIEYIGPIRPTPERFYVITQEVSQQWRQRGLQSYLNYLVGPPDDERDKRIDKWLQVMKLGQSLRRREDSYERPDNLLAVPELELNELDAFVITDETLEELRKEGVNDEIIHKLNGLKYQNFQGWKEFVEALESAIGGEGFGTPIGNDPDESCQSTVSKHIGRSAKVSFKDIGYGASQILPVIVQCLASAPDALVLIEQPELHLHPSAQADIANLLIESINEADKSRRSRRGKVIPEENKPEPVPKASRRYLVETHSETMLLRLRVELVRTTIGEAIDSPFAKEDLGCYFIERKDGSSTLQEVCFNQKGDYEKLPQEFEYFFGQDFKETLTLSKLQSIIEEDESNEDYGS